MMKKKFLIILAFVCLTITSVYAEEYYEKISLGTPAKVVKTMISYRNTMSIKNADKTDKKDDDVLKTGDLLSFKGVDNKDYNYTIVIAGDIDGDGQIKINDVTSAYKHLKKTTTLAGAKLKAANYVSTDSVILINDIAAMYKVVKESPAAPTFEKYTITLDANGGSASVKTVDVYTKSIKLNPQVTPTKTVKLTYDANGTGETISGESPQSNLTFTGWYLDNTTKTLAADNTTNSFVKSLSNVTDASGAFIAKKNLTLYAGWTSASVIVATATKEGYTCTWNTKADGTGQEVKANSTYTFANNTTLYAKCTANTYTISFDKNGGEGTMADVTCTSGVECTIPASNYTKGTDKIVGWWATTKDVCSGTTYEAGKTVNFLANQGDKITLYAHYICKDKNDTNCGQTSYFCQAPSEDPGSSSDPSKNKLCRWKSSETVVRGKNNKPSCTSTSFTTDPKVGDTRATCLTLKVAECACDGTNLSAYVINTDVTKYTGDQKYYAYKKSKIENPSYDNMSMFHYVTFDLSGYKKYDTETEACKGYCSTSSPKIIKEESEYHVITYTYTCYNSVEEMLADHENNN